MQLDLFGEGTAVRWARVDDALWRGTRADGATVEVEHLPMFNAWQWRAGWVTGSAPDERSARAAAESAPTV